MLKRWLVFFSEELTSLGRWRYLVRNIAQSSLDCVRNGKPFRCEPLSTGGFILKWKTLHLLITREQTDGEQWQRHRKMTASCLNERNNELVWSESLCQA